MSETRREYLENISLDEIRDQVAAEAPRIAELGNWPDWQKPHAVESLTSRVPSAENKNAEGFDAGVACALNLIPSEKQKLAATLHAAYTPEAVEQVRAEIKNMNPSSETAWWLGACSICQEGGVDEEKFRDQLKSFENLAADDNARIEAARKEHEKMVSTFSTEKYGIPFGTEDGCIQGAYIAGYPFGALYNDTYGIFFIGTYMDSLGLENFEWGTEKDEQGRDKSGPVFGSKSFVKCATEEEFLRAIEVVKKKFPIKE